MYRRSFVATCRLKGREVGEPEGIVDFEGISFSIGKLFTFRDASTVFVFASSRNLYIKKITSRCIKNYRGK